MERYQLDAAPRAMLGKQKVKKLRRQGWMPAVVYGRGIEPTPLQVRESAFAHLLKTVGANTLVDLKIEGNPATTAMVKKIQRNPINSALLNIDFHAVSVTDTITNRVPVELVGEAPGVAEGGSLLQPLTDVDIRGVAADLPTSIQADISNLGMGQSLLVSDLIVPEGIAILTPPDETVVAVHAPRVAAEEPGPAEKTTEP